MKNKMVVLLPLLLLACAEQQNFSGGVAKGTPAPAQEPPQAANIDPLPEEPIPQIEQLPEVQAPRIESVKAPSVEPVPVVEPEVPQEEPEVQPPAAEEDKSIEFGSDAVFRIGNGQAAASSCLSEIDSFDLSGTTFFFEFEVLNDATTVDLSIGRLCGVDTRSNVISLVDAGDRVLVGEKTLPQQVIEIQAFEPFAQQKLNRGIYTIVVKSKASGFLGDSDDFIVGKITVKADNAVKALQVYAE